MEEFELIRRLVLVEGLSQREVSRRLGVARKSVRKALARAIPKPYSADAKRSKPVLDPIKSIIDAWLDQDRLSPRKQRHTATRVYERLVAEHGYTGSLRTVCNYVGKRRHEESPAAVFAPIEYAPGFEAQIDWGEGTVLLNGVLTIFFFFCARLGYSKATFVRAYAKDDLASFLDGHVHLLKYLRGVPAQLAYDNLKSAVIKVFTGRKRELNRRLIELKSHYLFQTRFCNIASGNEKGHVENSVKRTERTYLTPIPQVTSLQELNALLIEHCLRDLNRIEKDSGKSYGELLTLERQSFRELPPDPFLACTTEPARIDKQSTVIHDRCRYSVPVRYARQHSRMRIFAERLEVIVGDCIVATHQRGEPGGWQLDFTHYIPLLDRKPGWLDSAKPFKTIKENPALLTLRRELEHRHGESGMRQFISILQLVEKHTWESLIAAIERCIALRVFHEQAVLFELQNADKEVQNWMQTELNFVDRPELTECCSGLRDPSIYDALLDGNASNCALNNCAIDDIATKEKLFDTFSSNSTTDDQERILEHAS